MSEITEIYHMQRDELIYVVNHLSRLVVEKDDEIKRQRAVQMALFSFCGARSHHIWNVDTGKCERCSKQWPYARRTPEDKK